MEENLYTINCVRTFSGQYLHVLDPDTITIFPIDIATQLARKCRFGGATKKFYSVAEHSVWCALYAEEHYPDKPTLPFLMLLHDAHEFSMGDVGSPYKRHMTGYKSLATKLQNAIEVRFRCFWSADLRTISARIDQKALEWEWDNKVLRWTGMELDEYSRRDYYLHHFKRLCKTPYVEKP